MRQLVKIVPGERAAAKFGEEGLLTKAVLKLVGRLDLRRNDIRDGRGFVSPSEPNRNAAA